MNGEGGHERNELKKGGGQMKHTKKKLSGVTYTIYIHQVQTAEENFSQTDIQTVRH